MDLHGSWKVNENGTATPKVAGLAAYFQGWAKAYNIKINPIIDIITGLARELDIDESLSQVMYGDKLPNTKEKVKVVFNGFTCFFPGMMDNDECKRVKEVVVAGGALAAAADEAEEEPFRWSVSTEQADSQQTGVDEGPEGGSIVPVPIETQSFKAPPTTMTGTTEFGGGFPGFPPGDGSSTSNTLSPTPSSTVSETSSTGGSEVPGGPGDPSTPSDSTTPTPTSTPSSTSSPPADSSTSTTEAEEVTTTAQPSTTTQQPEPPEEPSSTVPTGPTGEPVQCSFVGSTFADADCFLGICGGTRHDFYSELVTPRGEEPIEDEDVLWLDEETHPTDNRPWNFAKDSIGIQEDFSFDWDGDEECSCRVNGQDVETQIYVYEDGDGGFTYWSVETVCYCLFECHPSGG